MYSTDTTTVLNYPLLCIVERKVTMPRWMQEAASNFHYVKFDLMRTETKIKWQPVELYFM
jgi:hypothetical protein